MSDGITSYEEKTFREIVSESRMEARMKKVEALNAQTTAELTIRAGALAVRTGSLLYSLLSQRNWQYKDSMPYATRNNVLCVVALITNAGEARMIVPELLGRFKTGQSPFSLESNGKIDTASVVGDVTSAAILATQVRSGRTLFKKRELSHAGRIYEGVITAASLARLGVRLYTAVRR